MALCWITGVSGTGKTTIIGELQRRGEIAWDADKEFCDWRNRTTGEKTSHEGPRPADWVDENGWFIDPARVREFKESAGDRVAYLAGAVENENEVWDLFDTVVCLTADDDTIRHRLTNRTENSFGKSDKEMAMVLGWNAEIEKQYRAYGAMIINASQPLTDVVDAIRAAATHGAPTSSSHS